MSLEKLCSAGHVIGENESVCARDGGLPVNLPDPEVYEEKKEKIVDDEASEITDEPIIKAKAPKKAKKEVVAKKPVKSPAKKAKK